MRLLQLHLDLQLLQLLVGIIETAVGQSVLGQIVTAVIVSAHDRRPAVVVAIAVAVVIVVAVVVVVVLMEVIAFFWLLRVGESVSMFGEHMQRLFDERRRYIAPLGLQKKNEKSRHVYDRVMQNEKITLVFLFSETYLFEEQIGCFVETVQEFIV